MMLIIIATQEPSSLNPEFFGPAFDEFAAGQPVHFVVARDNQAKGRKFKDHTSRHTVYAWYACMKYEYCTYLYQVGEDGRRKWFPNHS
jgi:hypothetical protein